MNKLFATASDGLSCHLQNFLCLPKKLCFSLSTVCDKLPRFEIKNPLIVLIWYCTCLQNLCYNYISFSNLHPVISVGISRFYVSADQNFRLNKRVKPNTVPDWRIHSVLSILLLWEKQWKSLTFSFLKCQQRSKTKKKHKQIRKKHNGRRM